MKNPTPEDRDRWRRNAEFSRFARENMQRLIDEREARESEREERARRSLRRRLLGRATSAPVPTSPRREPAHRPRIGDPGFSRFARENMQRVIDEIDARLRERDERAQRS